MFLKFFQTLKISGIPVTIKEYLDMLKGLDKGICRNNNVKEFYFFSRMSLVKDEKYYDRFDKAFKSFYEYNKNFISEIKKQIPQDWLSNNLNKIFSEYMKKQIKNDKKWEEILKEF